LVAPCGKLLLLSSGASNQLAQRGPLNRANLNLIRNLTLVQRIGRRANWLKLEQQFLDDTALSEHKLALPGQIALTSAEAKKSAKKGLTRNPRWEILPRLGETCSPPILPQNEIQMIAPQCNCDLSVHFGRTILAVDLRPIRRYSQRRALSGHSNGGPCVAMNDEL
jgi:hypothetical protein